jgi:hypothetical protein
MLEDYTAQKLTQSQKRGYEPGKHSKKDMYKDRLRIMPVTPREPEELRLAQLKLAEIALAHPDLVSPQEREDWLREVLNAMGLGTEIVKGRKLHWTRR